MCEKSRDVELSPKINQMNKYQYIQYHYKFWENIGPPNVDT